MSNLPPWLATSSEELNQRMLRGLKEEIISISCPVIWSKFLGPIRFVSIFKPRGVCEILEPLRWVIIVLINNYQMRLNMIWRVLAEENRLQFSQLPVSRQVQDIEGRPVLQIMSSADILHSCYDFRR